MTRPPLPRTLLAAGLFAALALPSCGGGVAYVDISLVLKTCESSPDLDPLRDGASRLRFTIYGRGITPFSLQARQNVSTGAIDLAAIPPGNDRNIVVEAITAQGEVPVARGESGPLDLTSTEDTPQVAIFLRRLDAFSPAVPQNAPTTCTEMSSKRVGHTATRLSDGRVLIAGGYFDFDDGTGLKRQLLKSTELYDPRTGTLTRGPDMRFPRTNHTSTYIPGTKYTVVAGGDSVTSEGKSTVLAVAEIFDEARAQFILWPMRESRGRTKHAAAVPPTGGPLLLLGGYGTSGTVLQSTEQFDPQTLQFTDGSTLPAPGRAELGAVGLGNGRVLAVGGFDGTNVLKDALLFVARTGTPRYEISTDFNPSPGFAQPRLLPLMVALDDERALVTGGYTARAASGAPNHANATDLTDVVYVSDRKVEAATAAVLTRKRGQGGAVMLNDGTVLVASGAWQNAGGKPETHKSADIILPADQNAAAGLKIRKVSDKGNPLDGRYGATYTLLDDGTVLVAGGIEFKGDGTADFLSSVEIFQPNYQVSNESPYR